MAKIIRKKGLSVSSEISLMRPTDIFEFVQQAKKMGGWDQVWHDFWQIYKGYRALESKSRNIFVDAFYSSCLQILDLPKDSQVLWKVIEDWPVYRYLPGRSGGLPEQEGRALLDFSLCLRAKIYDYIMMTPFSEMSLQEGKRETSIIHVWWHVFFNYFSVLHIKKESQSDRSHYKMELFADGNQQNKYVRLLLASLYQPFHAEEFDIDMITLWNEPEIPDCYKVILSFWLTNIPYCDIEEEQRQRLLKAGGDLCHIIVPPMFFDSMVNHISNSFWLASYAGGNHVAALSGFGDFIADHMARNFPQYSLSERTPKGDMKHSKIKIGYISRCFYNQSVSYYMVNRVIHYDHEKFEVFIFALGTKNDDMTALFAKHASHFEQFTDLSTIQSIATSILACQLDVLIYAEIGMDPFTYTLAGMQLAPIQCVMVGHGTTTGLPTIEYYISGDFESFEAQYHYREKIIRLPNLGAAQYSPPSGSLMPSTRKEWNIPEEAILFVSCANGIKHLSGRDKLLVEIIKRIPNACIALKPNSSYDTGQQIEERILAVAKEAGVEKRIFIVPPLKHVGPLLAIADIALDTYPYGGWTTNMEALYVGLPIVTQEGHMARSRWGAHMLRALGIHEGIAQSEQEYVEWAVRFAHDRVLRNNVRNKIIDQVRQKLFNGEAAQSAYEEALLKIIKDNRQ